MHAYLIAGTNLEKLQQKIDEVIDGRKEIVTIETDKSHTIENIRTLQKEIAIAPQDPEKGRVVIIRDAHLLTQDASHAFLKTLEEPLGNTIFILATRNAEQILETIRSRTQIIQIPGDGGHEINLGYATTQFEKICKMSVGERIGEAESMGDRDEALKFCQEQLFAVRSILREKYDLKLVSLLENIQTTIQDLESYVNTKLTMCELLLVYPHNQ